MVSGDWSNYSGAKRDGKFGESRDETSRIARRTSGVEDKIQSNKITDLKGLAVTQPIMSMRKKDGKRDMKRSKNRIVTRMGGTQAVYCFV